ncbi:hypothetical protein I79_004107 [Cricetulus griseus]|uniref:Uncharacterized protein n=1 Tax=Cricetulus griseus TaxID=10029 RepID=G3H1S5_CRIGR|nr:hypothetical protein I79_004107 [Cricetulus griseus]
MRKPQASGKSYPKTQTNEQKTNSNNKRLGGWRDGLSDILPEDLSFVLNITQLTRGCQNLTPSSGL